MSPLSPDLRTSAKALIAYGLMLAAAVCGFQAIRTEGQLLRAPAAPPDFQGVGAATAGNIDTLLHVLFALVIIVIVARVLGSLFKLLNQPPVIGEVVGGLMLGPSLLGRFWPEASAAILPKDVAPFISVIAQIGVILYMFLVGLELDLREIRRAGHATLAISHASIVVPFLMGSALSLFLYPRLSHSGVDFTVFALFVGVSMSVTAFPVLARILTDFGISRSPMGGVALTCAAVDDATAWCLLAFVASIARSRVEDAVTTVLQTLAYVAMVLLLLRPLVERLVAWLDTRREVTQGAQAIVLAGMLFSALTTEFIGIHAIFGAFLMGAIIPHHSRVARELKQRIEDIVTVMFLPAFFAFTGMRTQIGLISGVEGWLLCGAVIAVACAGKFGGATIAARASGMGWRDASALGILMNTRGLVELIVLNLGLDLGVITPRFFAMLVLMALVTTLMTSPIFRWILKDTPWRVPEPEPEPASAPLRPAPSAG